MSLTELMELADKYAELSFDQGLHRRTQDDAPEAAREKLRKALSTALWLASIKET
jgi:hypothetical protein